MPKKPKRQNLKPQGRCIFCGGFGLSHEHVWADWLKEYIPRAKTQYTARKAYIDPFEEPEVILKKQTGDPHSRRVYCVCITCNSGWMSQLQELARPFLVPMLRGEKIELHKRAQTTVASWIAMMVMVGEYVNRDHVAIPQSDRQFLLENKRLPKHWRIWVGAHRNQTFALYTHNVLDFAEEGVEVAPGSRTTGQNTHATTICIGENLVVYVMSSIPARNIIRKWNIPKPIGAGMNQIWPIDSSLVAWSPSLRLTDAGLALLAEDFLETATRFLRSR